MFNQEDVLIPFSVSELPKGPWLVFAPHADDETFGMGGTLLKAKQQGIKTHLVVLTDGSLGGDAPDLVKVRQEFSKEAYLGVWNSVNDVRVQLGEKKFSEFVDFVKKRIECHDSIIAEYRTKAFIVRKV